MRIREFDTQHYKDWEKNSDEFKASNRVKDDYDSVATNIAQQMGKTIVKKLGAGTKGIAYLTNDNKVLKITDSTREANEFAKVKGKKFKHLVNIYDVKLGPGMLFGILQDYADTTSVGNDFRKVDYVNNEWELSGEEIGQELYQKLTPRQKEMFDWADDAHDEARAVFGGNPDIHTDNVGLRDGKLVAFDVIK